MSRAGDWPETAMERCAKCRICIKACPTGAIREDRFLISAERCYTLSSESKEPTPDWATPPASPCLIGCMACQEICPENKGRLRYEPSGVEFTAGETEALLEMGRRLEAEKQGEDSGGGEKEEARDMKHKDSDSGQRKRRESGRAGRGARALASALAKFERLGMSEDLEVVGRNLRYYLRSGLSNL